MNENKGDTAVVVPGRYDREETFARTRNALNAFGIETGGAIQLLSNIGSAIYPDRAGGKAAHLYAVLPHPLRALVITKRFPVLYPNAFTAAWAVMAVGINAGGGDLLLELDRAGRQERFIAYLTDSLKPLGVGIAEKRKKQWVALGIPPAATKVATQLLTIYPYMHNRYEEFKDIYFSSIELNLDRDDPAMGKYEAKATSTFIYSLFGANQKSFVVEKILRDFGISTPGAGIDIGGGYGFLAAELAKKGWRYTVVDNDRTKLDVGPWLMESCGTASSISLRHGTMEQVGRLEGAYDMVSFFGSLLYASRDQVPDIIESAMRLLNPGGLLLVHENPQDTAKPGMRDYEIRFRMDELRALLEKHAGPARAYSMFSGDAVSWEQAGKSVMMVAVQKG